MSEVAPRPTRTGITRGLYDAISANGGTAKRSQIRQLLPATDDYDKWQWSNKQIKAGYNRARNLGYIKHHKGGYRIATLNEYYSSIEIVDCEAHHIPHYNPNTLVTRYLVCGLVVSIITIIGLIVVEL